VWYDEEVKEKLRMKNEHLNILFSCLNGKKMMNSESTIFFYFIPEPLELYNRTPNQP
jgi:hypothetical protein